ncbi:hypothetical protein KDK77_02535 [bacterium]|nr:hypothetical protein [bacterium]
MQSRRIFRFFMLLTAFFFVMHGAAYPEEIDMGEMTPQEEVDHYQAQGYMFILDNRLDKAAAAFERAGSAAVKNSIWDGCIDAALGLIMLEQYPKARAVLRASGPVIIDSGDVRAHIAMAYAILTFAPEERRNLRADRYLEEAYALSRRLQNAYAFIETSKGFLENIDRGKSYALLFEAKMIAEKRRNAEVMELLAHQFILHGNTDVSDTCRRMAQRYQEKPMPFDNEGSISQNTIAEFKELQLLDTQQREWINEFAYFYQRPIDLSLGYSPHIRRVWCTNRLVLYSEVNKRYRRQR